MQSEVLVANWSIDLMAVLLSFAAFALVLTERPPKLPRLAAFSQRETIALFNVLIVRLSWLNLRAKLEVVQPTTLLQVKMFCGKSSVCTKS